MKHYYISMTLKDVAPGGFDAGVTVDMLSTPEQAKAMVSGLALASTNIIDNDDKGGVSHGTGEK